MKQQNITLGLGDLVSGYFRGIWLKFSGGLKRQLPKQSLETVNYTEFHNPHVSILDTIYPEIGLGVYQNNLVIIRQGVTQSKFRSRWVVYKLNSRFLKLHQADKELLNTACLLVHELLLKIYCEPSLKDSEMSNEPTIKLDHPKCQHDERGLCPPSTFDCSGIYPIQDEVCQVLQTCPRIKSLLFRDILSQEKHDCN